MRWWAVFLRNLAWLWDEMLRVVGLLIFPFWTDSDCPGLTELEASQVVSERWTCFPDLPTQFPWLRVVWAGWLERSIQYTLFVDVSVWSTCLETMLSPGKHHVQRFHGWMPPSLGCVQVASRPCVCTKLWCSRRLGPVETRLTKLETPPESASQIFKSYQPVFFFVLCCLGCVEWWYW